jgi:hypothetical protein
MRTFDGRAMCTAALLGLTACAPDARDATGAKEVVENANNVIECALHGAATFVRECTVERSRQSDGEVLTVRHPDGGFRRFEMLGEGRGLGPADGAESAELEWREGGIGLVVGADRYRFPAAILNHDSD